MGGAKRCNGGVFTSRICRRSAITTWYYQWGFTKDQIGTLIGTKKLEILNVYISRDKDHKVQLLENI
jgi:hypothetical protein